MGFISDVWASSEKKRPTLVAKMVRYWCLWAIALGQLPTVLPAQAQTQTIPLMFRQTSGLRPYVKAKLNGLPLLLMVHSNANFTVMTTHQHAAEAKVGEIHFTDSYGITKPGAVSQLGRGWATLQTLQVGSSRVHDVRLSVFEIPQDPPVDGMLGITWLKSQRVLVDFSGKQLQLPTTIAAAKTLGERLVQQGFEAHTMHWDQNVQSFTLPVLLNGQSATFTVSTVSDFIVDEKFAAQARLTAIVQPGNFGGPTGTTGTFSSSNSSFTLLVDGQAVKTSPATIFDTYAYEARPRPIESAQLISGALGCDFMLANNAVIDFGNGILYLKP